MPATAKKNLHLTLPPELHAQLKEQSNRLGEPSTTLARAAIDEWVKRQRREQIAEELREYATKMAGTGVDLDPELEAVGVENWLENVP